MRRAWIYSRLSKYDKQGVENHAAWCRRLVTEAGWELVGESSDDAISAIDRHRMEGFDAMAQVIAERRIDTVVTFEASRLFREAVDFMVFARDCHRQGVHWIVTRDGELSTGAGVDQVRVFLSGWQASEERRHLIARINEELAANAAKGLSHGGRTPGFGYLGPLYDAQGNRVRRNGHEVDPEQAELIREARDRVLAGEPLLAICRDWDARGVKPPRSARWRSHSLRAILLNPRIAGRRRHNGSEVEAAWPAIITPAQRHELRVVLEDPDRRTNRVARTYLLTGVLHCSDCAIRMHGHAHRGRPGYTCHANRGGCWRFIDGPHTDDWISAAVLEALTDPAFRDALASAESDTSYQEATETLRAAETHLEDLARMLGTEELSPTEWRVSRAGAQAKVEAAKAKLAATRHSSALERLPHGDVLRKAWALGNLPFKRMVIGMALGRVEVGPAEATRRARWDWQRLHPNWRV